MQDYMDPNIPTKGFFTNVRYMFDLRDVVVDVQGAPYPLLLRCRPVSCCSFAVGRHGSSVGPLPAGQQISEDIISERLLTNGYQG